jgi:GAF domain-containing protein
MKPRSRAAGTKKARRRKSVRRKDYSKQPGSLRHLSTVELNQQLDRRTRELAEAVDQQTATSALLGVISSSPGELDPVFEVMLTNATRLCEAKFGTLYLCEGGGLRLVATHKVPPAFAEACRCELFYPRGHIAEAIRTKQTTRIADFAATRLYAERHPSAVVAVELGGIRTTVAVPLLKDDGVAGVIVIYRQEVRPYTDKQVALLKNFASHAVIAIENTRLLNELRQRTNDLEQSYAMVRQQSSQLEQQSRELRALNQQLEQRVADQVSEIERMGRLRRFLPPQVADLIVSSGTEKQLESHAAKSPRCSATFAASPAFPKVPTRKT